MTQDALSAVLTAFLAGMALFIAQYVKRRKTAPWGAIAAYWAVVTVSYVVKMVWR